MAVDYIASDEPAYCAAYEDIGGEVLAGEDTRQADAGGKAVGGDLRERAFVLGSDDGGGRPRDDGVIGRERRVEADACLEEFAFGVVDGRPFPLGNNLEDLVYTNAVEYGFAAEDAGFSGVLVVMNMADAIDDGGCNDESANQTIGGSGGVAVERGILEFRRRHDLVVSGDGEGSAENEGDGDDGVRLVDMGGTGPDCFLIVQDVAWDGAQGDGRVGFGIGVGLRLGCVRQRGSVVLGAGGSAEGQRQECDENEGSGFEDVGQF